MIRLLLAGAALAALAAPSALAQSQLSSSQVRLDDSFAAVDVDVYDADEVNAVSNAGGNSFSAAAYDRSLVVHGAQRSQGDARAQTSVQSGAAYAVNAEANASANIVSAAAESGDLTLVQGQSNSGSIEANVEADLCCVSDAATASASASGNVIATTGYTTTMLTATDQTNSGDGVTAHVDLYARSAAEASAQASASGNALTLDNQWGYVNAAARQDNRAGAIAEAYVTLGDAWLASAAAYGVGNSAVITNIGSDTVIDTQQSNSGFVGAYAASVNGYGDADGSATAYGNVVTAALCNSCGEAALSASNAQVNDGRVESVVTLRARRGGVVTGNANAIGNAAAYSVTGED